MLDLVSSGFVSLWLKIAGVPQSIQPEELLAAWTAPGLVLSHQPDPAAVVALEQYLQDLTATGVTETNQGIWIQSGYHLLADHQGTEPLPAASLTKVATSLAALKTWGPDHQFETLVSATGPIQNGVLQGDLVIQGNNDPFFVWEEAIALGNALNRLGLRQVTGNLIITGNFAMNYEVNPQVAGAFLKQALNSQQWSDEITAQHQTLPTGTPKPQVAIAGNVQVATLPIPKQIALLRHQSLPLAQILKQMNIYSNNAMAEMLAASVGGEQVVAQLASQSAGFPRHEIQLINGSGLGPENRISPRAICAMFMAIEAYLRPRNMTIADLFPISGRDVGTLIDRTIPTTAVVKTGTLWNVSSLAGALPTRDRGLVWFAIINRGEDLDGLRHRQDGLLQNLVQKWGVSPTVAAAIAPSMATQKSDPSNSTSDRTASNSATTTLSQPARTLPWLTETSAQLTTHPHSSQRHTSFALGDQARNEILYQVEAGKNANQVRG